MSEWWSVMPADDRSTRSRRDGSVQDADSRRPVVRENHSKGLWKCFECQADGVGGMDGFYHHRKLEHS